MYTVFLEVSLKIKALPALVGQSVTWISYKRCLRVLTSLVSDSHVGFSNITQIL